jgi:hypothetical protein
VCARSAALAEAARIEATALADVSFGAPMLHAIGCAACAVPCVRRRLVSRAVCLLLARVRLRSCSYVYQNKAEQFLGNPLVCGSITARSALACCAAACALTDSRLLFT